MKHGVREVVLLSNLRIFRTQFLKEFFEPKVSIKQTLNYTHFFVKRIMSFPIRIVPLKCRNTYITTSENICKSAAKCLIYSNKKGLNTVLKTGSEWYSNKMVIKPTTSVHFHTAQSFWSPRCV